ncbi:hypothetical protein BQ8482_110318 [Mesorhizobium delmotii]|uniref:Alkyl hydroperoxide reductase subunit C/ Thiol specific antioxidant domain-containing protein n=1 Tax=Mesorhizobium delmotii TaxID=1631247 RepID=A0A2P9AB72_9HYPH|nr:hypothetical protein BQ8482_110318 [Mesorhizobium delmotii]
MAQLKPALREKGVECLAVVITPVERAQLYFRYHPAPDLLAASDPKRASHRAFGLRHLYGLSRTSMCQRRRGTPILAFAGGTSRSLSPWTMSTWADRRRPLGGRLQAPAAQGGRLARYVPGLAGMSCPVVRSFSRAR